VEDGQATIHNFRRRTTPNDRGLNLDSHRPPGQAGDHPSEKPTIGGALLFLIPISPVESARLVLGRAGRVTPLVIVISPQRIY